MTTRLPQGWCDAERRALLVSDSTPKTPRPDRPGAGKHASDRGAGTGLPPIRDLFGSELPADHATKALQFEVVSEIEYISAAPDSERCGFVEAADGRVLEIVDRGEAGLWLHGNRVTGIAIEGDRANLNLQWGGLPWTVIIDRRVSPSFFALVRGAKAVRGQDGAATA
jgi:hypothetical protein